MYRFIIAVLLFSAVPTACGFCGYMVAFAEAGFCWFRASERARWIGDEVVGKRVGDFKAETVLSQVSRESFAELWSLVW